MKRCLLRNKTSIFQRRLKKKEKLSLAASFKRDWGKSSLSLAEFLARIFLRSKMRMQKAIELNSFSTI